MQVWLWLARPAVLRVGGQRQGQGSGSEGLRAGAEVEVAGGSKSEADTIEAGRTK